MNRKVRLTSVQQLPLDFTSQVLDLESRLLHLPSLETLRNLLQLYSQAIEYYESVKDPKFNYYQEKMKEILSKSHLNQNKSIGTTSTPSLDLGLKQLRKADLTIQLHEKNSVRLSREISLNLYKQNLEITTKLKNRISKNNSPKVNEPKSCKARTGKLGKFFGDSEDDEIEKSPINIVMETDALENQLEGVIESFIIKKWEKSKEIKKKYKSEIQEVLNMKGGPIFTQLAAEIEKNMQTELYELDQSLISEKKLAIKQIKQCVTP